MRSNERIILAILGVGEIEKYGQDQQRNKFGPANHKILIG
jgi:hypothetical protein